MAMKSTAKPPRRLNCPIEPEMLLAHIQGELTIDEARLVEAHLRDCDQCRATAQQLRTAYEHVASLADVPTVPPAGLRETLLRESHGRLRSVRFSRGLNLSGRVFLLLAVGAVLAALVLTVAIVRPLLQSGPFTAQRSVNVLGKAAPVGQGLVYAQSVKLIPVNVGNAEWDLGEVLVINETNGLVVHSWPTSTQAAFVPQLGANAGVNIPPALSPDGKTLVQAAIPADGHSPSAFAAVDTATGTVKYVAQLALPAGAAAQANPILQQIWIGRDNATVYALTDLVINGQRTAHLLTFNLADGQQQAAIIPPLDGANPGAGIGGYVSTLSADNMYFYDAQLAVDDHNRSGALISFVRLANQQIESTLFIPGIFRGMALQASPDGQTLMLFNGNMATVTFISTKTRAVVGTLTLAPGEGQLLTTNTAPGTLTSSLALTPDGTTLYVARDEVVGTKRDFTIWTVNVLQQRFVAITKLDQPVGTLALTSNASHLLLLRSDGTLQTLDVTTAAPPLPWVKLDGNTIILSLAGSFLAPSL